ncbi:MAG: TraR/DksA family transcriptional regulator [Acidimicrobiales bacterium]
MPRASKTSAAPAAAPTDPQPAPKPTRTKTAAPRPAVAKPAVARQAAPRAGADKFLVEQRALLQSERATYAEQAVALKAQADQMAQEMEPGDIQFDDESGEGASANVDRERDLALSAQARAAVDEIDRALVKIDAGTYGICEGCGQPILRARLKALPHARLCVACKSGGLSRR